MYFKVLIPFRQSAYAVYKTLQTPYLLFPNCFLLYIKIYLMSIYST
jgi:hypothetical protein